MLRTLLAVILALAVSAADAQIVNRPVGAGAISNPGTSLPATCAVGYVYFKSNSTAGQNLHLCTAANTWTQMTGGNLANPVTPGQGGSGVANTKNLTWSASLTFAGTDATTMTFPGTSATIARTDAANTFTGLQTYSSGIASTGTLASGTYSLQVLGASGADRSLAQVGVSGVTNGFTATYTTATTSMAYSFLAAGSADTFTVGPIASFSISAISPLFRSNTAKVLVQGTGTGATQLAATQTTVPTCSSNCGTSPSVVGTDTAGIITMGASGVPASGFVLTFNGTWAAAPACIVTGALGTMVVAKNAANVVTTTTTMTVVTGGTAPSTSDKYAYHCIGVS